MSNEFHEFGSFLILAIGMPAFGRFVFRPYVSECIVNCDTWYRRSSPVSQLGGRPLAFWLASLPSAVNIDWMSDSSHRGTSADCRLFVACWGMPCRNVGAP